MVAIRWRRKRIEPEVVAPGERYSALAAANKCRISNYFAIILPSGTKFLLNRRGTTQVHLNWAGAPYDRKKKKQNVQHRQVCRLCDVEKFHRDGLIDCRTLRRRSWVSAARHQTESVGQRVTPANGAGQADAERGDQVGQSQSTSSRPPNYTRHR